MQKIQIKKLSSEKLNNEIGNCYLVFVCSIRTDQVSELVTKRISKFCSENAINLMFAVVGNHKATCLVKQCIRIMQERLIHHCLKQNGLKNGVEQNKVFVPKSNFFLSFEAGIYIIKTGRCSRPE